MNLISPDFSSWPISTSLKTLLLKEDKWPDYYSINTDHLAMALNSFNMQIKGVNFFNSFPETNLFFKFLSGLIESKPQNRNVLKEFSKITVVILDKLSLESRFNSEQASVAIEYLKLLSLMSKPNYGYLFEKPEISLGPNDFQKISNQTFQSSALLSQFRNTLLLCFQSSHFIRNYPILIQTIRELAYSLDKVYVDSNALEAMKLFNTLGVLAHTLKSIQVGEIVENLMSINQSIQDTRELIYNQFEPYVEGNFLKFIVYQSYLKQSYLDSANLSGLCGSEKYQAQCKSNYIRYNDSYRCVTDQFPDFSINIKSNNRSNLYLGHLCVAMRSSEWFVNWMNELGFKRIYNASATTKQSYHVHEYNHHLFAQFIDDLELDLTLTEGLAELFSGGICSKKNINDLRSFVNDTFIFEFFKARKYPFFNALKWVAYLVNEQSELFKMFVNNLQNNDTESFYASIDSFIDNASSVMAFVNWSHQQVNTCNNYLNIFPTGHQPSIIYLEEIKNFLSQAQMMESPTINSGNILQNFLFSSDKDLYAFLVPYSSWEVKAASKEFSQQIQIGIPLPLAALFAGFTSSCFDEVSLAYGDKYPSLPAYIHYGFKPFVFAALNAGLNALLFDQKVEAVEEKFARLFNYFVMNFLSVLIGQSLTKKLAEKIHNKLLCFLYRR